MPLGNFIYDKVFGKAIAVDDEDHEITLVTCPLCQGLFAVDSTFLDQVSDLVCCPMCQSQVGVDDSDAAGYVDIPKLQAELVEANRKLELYRSFVQAIEHGPVGITWFHLDKLQRAWDMIIKTAEAVIKNAERK